MIITHKHKHTTYARKHTCTQHNYTCYNYNLNTAFDIFGPRLKNLIKVCPYTTVCNYCGERLLYCQLISNWILNKLLSASGDRENAV